MSKGQLSSISAVSSDLANHTKVLGEIRALLHASGIAGKTLGEPVDQHLLGPGPIGKTNPNSGAFTDLILSTPVATPANGQIGKGDVAWVEVGSGGTAPAFPAGVTNSGGGDDTAAFRKMPDGVVQIKGCVNMGANGTGAAAFNLPSGYRPALRKRWPGVNNTTSDGALIVEASGAVTIYFTSGLATIRSLACSFPAEG